MANSFYEDQVRRNRLYAQSLLAQGSDTSPVGHPLAAVARAVQGAMGGYIDYKDEQKDKANQTEANAMMAKLLMGNQPAPAPSPSMGGNAAPMSTPPMGNLPRMNSRVYDQAEFNPMDAQVATQDELGAGVPAPKQYAALIGKAAVDNDLSPQMLARQIRQESGFNPNAVSSAGATGISQFMPATAREMGVTNPRDPSQAIPAGAQYLRQNIDKFGGSIPLGLAAYNAGPGRVERSGGDISKLPAETQGYVKNIAGATQMAQAEPRGGNAAQIAEMLQNKNNPYVQRLGQQLAQQQMAAQAAAQKPTDEMREYQLYKQQGGNKSFFDYKADLKKAGAVNVQTNVGGGSDKQIFDTMDESAKSARTVAAGLTGLREARAALQGGAITGAGAEQILGLQKIGAALGITDPSKIVNTETFRAAIAPQIAAILKSTVGTANISNTDREFAEKAAGGNITLDGKTIARLLDIMERASTGQLEGHMNRLEKVYPDAEKHARERALFGVDMPPPAKPPADQGGWKDLGNGIRIREKR
jgi:soluble lytic murein transglycosylase-like protein